MPGIALATGKKLEPTVKMPGVFSVSTSLKRWASFYATLFGSRLIRYRSNNFY